MFRSIFLLLIAVYMLMPSTVFSGARDLACLGMYPPNVKLEYHPKLEAQFLPICNTSYAVTYFPACKIPILTWERLDSFDLQDKVDRIDSFRLDPRIDPDYQISPRSYRNTGFDRGHMAPSDNYKMSVFAQRETFLMTNIIPQLPKFNRVLWRSIEQEVQDIVRMMDGEPVYVITGSMGTMKPPRSVGKSCRTSHFFKVILDSSGNYIAGFFAEHSNDFETSDAMDYYVPRGFMEKHLNIRIMDPKEDSH